MEILLNDNLLSVVRIVLYIMTVSLFLYAAYFFVIGLFSLTPNPKYQDVEKKARFAIVIAARNEEAVIGNLVESLGQQNYPRELYDIIVIPNNCTDSTEERAQEKGAQIFKCKRTIKSKGEVLAEFFDYILENRDNPQNQYDAYCIFDADNLVDPEFLKAMNKAVQKGANAAQGYRDTKNPYDTAISSSYAIYYYLANHFYNHPRHYLGLSALISGSGFMVSHNMIAKMNGWNTKTMTEDIELTAKCILNGYKVFWVPEAIIYDEQPLTFSQSWRQRKRWTTGLIQSLEHYVMPLIKNTFNNKSFKSFDMIMFLMALSTQILYILSILLTMILDYDMVKIKNVDYMYVIYRFAGALILSYLVCVIVTTLVVKMAKKKPFKMIKGILFFWVFVFSWVPINLICMFKKETTWHQIDHTVAVKIDQVTTDSD